MTQDNKVKVVVAVIGAIATVVASGLGFWGGQTVETNNVKEQIQQSQVVTINEGESTGEVISRLIDKNEDLEKENKDLQDEKSQQDTTVQELKQQVEDLKQEVAAANQGTADSTSSYNKLEKEYNAVVKERDLLKKQLNDKNGVATIPEDGVALTTLEIFNSNYAHFYVSEGGMEDTLGYEYDESSTYIKVGWYDWHTGSGEYFVDGKYSRLTGNIAPHSSAQGESTSKVQIWGDDKLIYESKDIGIRTDVFSFELGADKFAGVRFLKIVQTGSNRIPLLLTDWTLS